MWGAPYVGGPRPALTGPKPKDGTVDSKVFIFVIKETSQPTC